MASDGCIPISFTAYGNGGTPSSMLFCSLYEVDIACASHFNIVTFSSGPTTYQYYLNHTSPGADPRGGALLSLRTPLFMTNRVGGYIWKRIS